MRPIDPLLGARPTPRAAVVEPDAVTPPPDAAAPEPGATALAPEGPATAPTSRRGRRRARRRARRAARSRAKRVVRRCAVGVVVVVAVPTIWSYVGYLTKPGSDPLSARSVEWVRDHGGEGFVNWFENWWYRRNAPKEGAELKGGLATVPAAISVTSTVPATTTTAGPATTQVAAATTTTIPPNLARPTDIVPFVADPLPGEGVWAPAGRTSPEGLATTYVTYLRPDARHTGVQAAVAWMDTKLLRAVFVPGLQEPEGTPQMWRARVPVEERASLAVTFNGAFRTKHSRGGYVFDGQVVQELRDGAASLVVHRDGRPDVGMWGRDFTLDDDIAVVRQNIDLLVDGGHIADGLDDPRQSWRWGPTVDNEVYVWRSGLGVDASGALVYVAGSGLSAHSMANLMIAAGVVRGMTLDINSAWVSFALHTPADPADPTAVASDKLLPGMSRPATRYLSSGERDFVALFVR